MSVDIIQLPTDGSGKKIAARSYTEGANTVYAQAGYIATDAGLQTASLTNATAGATSTATITGLGTATGNLTITVHGTYGFTTTPPTYVFEASDDTGTTWYPTAVIRQDTNFRERNGTLAANTSRSWVMDCGGIDQIRFRITAWGTPTGSISVRGTPGGMYFEPATGAVPASKTNLSLIANAVSPGTAGTDTIQTLTPYRDGVAGSTGTTFTPAAGFKWRIVTFAVTWRNTTAAINACTGFLRYNGSGAAIVSSPMYASASGSATVASIGAGGTGIIIFPEGGLQLDPGQNIAVTTIGSLAATGAYLSVTGYEY